MAMENPRLIDDFPRKTFISNGCCIATFDEPLAPLLFLQKLAESVASSGLSGGAEVGDLPNPSEIREILFK